MSRYSTAAPVPTTGARATIYTTLGQTLRVPLTAGGPPENQLISWFNRQEAANPGFPRRVRSILLLPGARASGAGTQALRRFLGRWQLADRLRVVTPGGARPAGLSGELETAMSIMHSNIDVAAQRALKRMLDGPDPYMREAAAQLLEDVRIGKLRGIYQEDQQVPALRARRQGRGWWQIIRQFSDAERFPDPAEPPLIVFRRGIDKQPGRLEEALLTVKWHPLAPPPKGYYGRPM
jgi:hypothetical protein